MREYLLGRGGLMARLSLSEISVASVSARLVGLLGGRNGAASHRVRWDQMDLSDPEHPRLKCGADELPPVEPEPAAAKRR